MNGARAAEHRLVHVGEGLRLHAAVRRREGSVPLLLLHGFTGSAETWTALCDALADVCTTIAVDLPGHGRSGAPADPARYALPRLAGDLARLLDALGVERAVVLGYSLGGRAALHFAASHPSRVTALVLESASPGIADAHERAARAMSDAALADAVERDGVAAFVERWEAMPLWASQAALPAPVRGALREQRLRNDPRGLANSLRGAGAGAVPALDAELATIDVPALLIVGALDARYVAVGESLAARLPRAGLLVVPDAGHAVHLEQPGAFVAAVHGFVTTLRHSPAQGQR